MTARSSKTVREACEAGGSAATQLILSRVDKKLIRSLDVQVSSEQKDGTTFNVEVSLDVEPALEIDLDELTDAAVESALAAIEGKMQDSTKTKANARKRKEQRG